MPCCLNPDNWSYPRDMWIPLQCWWAALAVGPCMYPPILASPFQWLVLHPVMQHSSCPNLHSSTLLIVVCLLGILSASINHAASASTQSHRSTFALCTLLLALNWLHWCHCLELLRCRYATARPPSYDLAKTQTYLVPESL